MNIPHFPHVSVLHFPSEIAVVLQRAGCRHIIATIAGHNTVAVSCNRIVDIVYDIDDLPMALPETEFRMAMPIYPNDDLFQHA